MCGRPWQIEMSGIKLPWTLSVWISWYKDCGSWPWQMYSTDNMTRIQDERERERERGGDCEREREKKERGPRHTVHIGREIE